MRPTTNDIAQRKRKTIVRLLIDKLNKGIRSDSAAAIAQATETTVEVLPPMRWKFGVPSTACKNWSIRRRSAASVPMSAGKIL